MGFLDHKKFLVAGIVSNRSIAYGAAEALVREGASLCLSYQNEKLKDRMTQIAETLPGSEIYPCDVSNDSEIHELFLFLKEHWGTFNGIIHSVAYAPNGQLEGDYLDNVTREGFSIAHNISSYSFAALAKEARSLLVPNDSSLVTMSYLGSERVIPHYNVMGVAKASLEANVRYLAHSLGRNGIRVNAISAGPIKTLAAAGIRDFRKMLEHHERMSPIHQNVTIENIGNTTAFLCSKLASGITGEIIHVDNGFHMMAMSDYEVEM